MDQKPSIGRIVHYFPNEADTQARANGATVVSAIITTVWNPETGYVNLTIFPDLGGAFGRLSIYHKSTATEGNSYWDWPARV